MKVIAISDVVIPPNRQRQEFDARKLEELHDSIYSPIGLLQPIVLRNDAKTLIAGERRLRAISQEREKQLKHDGQLVDFGFIPFVVTSELSPKELREAELHENLHRTNLTWQEEAKAIAELHEFRMELTEGKQTIRQTTVEVTQEAIPDGTRWTADMQKVSDSIDLAKLLDNPLIAAASSMKDAKKVLKTLQENERRKQLSAEWADKEFEHRLILGSCYEELAKDEYTGRFDVILTDPPYGVDMDKKETFDADSHEYDDSYEVAFKQLCEEFPGLAYRVAAQQAHLFVFCHIIRFPELWTSFTLGGWNVWQTPLIWDKRNVGSYGNITRGFRQTYDAILFANKGQREMATFSADVFSIAQRTNLPHPAGKPVELFTAILRCCALPGNRVLDAFCGHGPIFPACSAVKCIATGIEKKQMYFDMSVETLVEMKAMKKEDSNASTTSSPTQIESIHAGSVGSNVAATN